MPLPTCQLVHSSLTPRLTDWHSAPQEHGGVAIEAARQFNGGVRWFGRLEDSDYMQQVQVRGHCNSHW